MSPSEKIPAYINDVLHATSLLLDHKLPGQLLISIFASVDTMGLLGAAAHIERASGETFKAWVRKYMLSGSDLPCSDSELWGARCGILHTYKTESDLSRDGKVREIKFYRASHPSAVAALKDIAIDQNSVACDYRELYIAFLSGIQAFMPKVIQEAEADGRIAARVDKIIHLYQISVPSGAWGNGPHT